MSAKKEIKYLVEFHNGERYMECKSCGQMSKTGESSTAVTCHDCVREDFEKEFPFESNTGYKPTGRPRGWAFMKEYVDKDGNVYHKGKEQPDLKGTLKPTVIKSKPKKPKLTKRQKQQQQADALIELHKLKKQLNNARWKKDKRKITAQIKKVQKLIK